MCFLGLLGKHGRDGIPGFQGEKGKVLQEYSIATVWNTLIG